MEITKTIYSKGIEYKKDRVHHNPHGPAIKNYRTGEIVYYLKGNGHNIVGPTLYSKLLDDWSFYINGRLLT